MTEIIRAPVFIDIEASGLTSGVPIEIGWARVTNGVVTSESQLIKPPREWEIEGRWDDTAASLHQITLEQLMQLGGSPFDIAKRMNDQLTGDELFSDSPFDKHWLTVLFDATPYTPAFVIRNLSAEVLIAKTANARGLSTQTLAKLTAQVSGQRRRVHRAEDDAKYWAQMWLAIHTPQG